MAEKFPWSISTTVRNPDRLRNFLKVLKKIEGEIWNNETQRKYQIMLIQERFYGFGNRQFYNASRHCKALKKEQVHLIESMEPISFAKAKEIFETKDYVDPAHRGRESINPIKKLGLASIKNQKIKITSLGEYLLREDYDLGEMFFKSFLKWQLPNLSNDDYREEEGYDIKPFIGTLHLINEVNKKWSEFGENPVVISKEEFFTPCYWPGEKFKEN